MATLTVVNAFAMTLQPRMTRGWLELNLPRISDDDCCEHAVDDAYKTIRKFSLALASDNVDGVLLTSTAGNSFSTGGDVSELATNAFVYGPATARAYLRAQNTLALQLRRFSQTKPVIAIADGVVAGSSAALFLAATQRIAAADIVLSVPRCTVGLCPDCGAIDLLTSGAVMPPSLGLVCLLSGGRLPAGGEIIMPGLAAAADLTAMPTATHKIASGEATWQTLRDSLLARTPASSSETLGTRSAVWGEEAAATASVAAAATASVAAAESTVPTPTDRLDSGRRVAVAVERVVSRTHAIRNDAVGRIDAIQLGLTAEADGAKASGDGVAAAWLAEQSAGIERGCPAAQIVTYVAARRAALDRQATESVSEVGVAVAAEEDALVCRTLGMELAANTVLANRADFHEGVSCAMGLRCGDRPVWQHSSRQEAAEDPEVRELVACVLSAPPFAPDDQGPPLPGLSALPLPGSV